MLSSAPELACTSIELVYLASLRGGQSIVGIADPLRDRTPEDVADALRTAQGALAARRFLAVEPDGSIVLDYDVARVVDAVVKPRRTVCVYRVRSDGSRRVFHVRGSLVVELVAERDDVRLVPLPGRAAIAEAVLQFWEVADQLPVKAEPAVLAQRVLHEAARLAASDASTYLLAQGVPAASAGPLAATLARPRQNTALLIYDGSGLQEHMLGMSTLEGENGLWRLRPVPGDAVEVVPCSGPELAAWIRDLISTVL
jgi:hypothetical protein